MLLVVCISALAAIVDGDAPVASAHPAGGVAIFARSANKSINLVRKETHTDVRSDALKSVERSDSEVKRNVDDAVKLADGLPLAAQSPDKAVFEKWHLPMSNFVGVTSWLQKVGTAVPMQSMPSSFIDMTSASSRETPALEGYSDANCADSSGGYELPKKVEIPDDCCIAVKSSKDDNSKAMEVMGVHMNLKIICMEGQSSKVGIIFGTDCSTGFQDNMVLEFDEKETKKLGSGGCAKGMNYKNNLEEYMKFHGMDNIMAFPKCYDSINWVLYGCIVGGVALFLVICGCVFVAANTEDPIKRRKRLREEREKEEAAYEKRMTIQSERRASRLSALGTGSLAPPAKEDVPPAKEEAPGPARRLSEPDF
mmetsp:Transcript_102640/g.178061  ORF Transcript_102640/g.178061 Transcript_102640/m.178061 type:complete len:367 (-) Transcript_102640:98-1198(-)